MSPHGVRLRQQQQKEQESDSDNGNNRLKRGGRSSVSVRERVIIPFLTMMSTYHNRALLVVHLNIVVYAACYWLSSPIIPYLIKEFSQAKDPQQVNASIDSAASAAAGKLSLELGAFQSLFNIVQLGGGLTVGFLQDKFSGPTALSLTQIGSAGVYLCLLLATSTTGLYVSRILTIAQQSMQVAQAVISKATIVQALAERGEKEEGGKGKGDQRAVALGQLSLSYSVGMIIGSSASGPLSTSFSNTFALAIAVGLSLGVVPLNRFFLQHLVQEMPEQGNNKREQQDETEEPLKEKQQTEIMMLTEKERPSKNDDGWKGGANYISLAYNARGELLFLFFVYSTRALFEPVMSTLLLESFHWPQRSMGTLLAVFAIMALLGNVAVLPLLVKVFSEYFEQKRKRKEDSSSSTSAQRSEPQTQAASGNADGVAGPKTIKDELDHHTASGDKVEGRIIQCCVVSLGLVFATLALLQPKGIEGVWVFVGLMVMMSLLSGMLYTLTTSYLSRTADGHAQGKVIAMSHATRSAVGIVLPLVGSGLFEFGGLGLVSAVTTGLLVLAFFTTLRAGRSHV